MWPVCWAVLLTSYVQVLYGGKLWQWKNLANSANDNIFTKFYHPNFYNTKIDNCNYYPNQNTPGVKKVAAKNLKKGHAEKNVKSKWAAKASCC